MLDASSREITSNATREKTKAMDFIVHTESNLTRVHELMRFRYHGYTRVLPRTILKVVAFRQHLRFQHFRMPNAWLTTGWRASAEGEPVTVLAESNVW